MKHLKLFFALFAMLALGVGNAWGAEVTINFGSGPGDVNVNDFNISTTDTYGTTWSISTVATYKSFTPNADYSQIGASKKPATTITLTGTIVKACTINSISSKWGGFSGTAGNIEISVNGSSYATGKLNAANDVTVGATNDIIVAAGDKIVITVTSIAKGVKLYSLSYTYTQSTGGGETPDPTPDPEPDPTPGTGGTGTINFNSNAVKINAASVTGKDNLNNIWTITTAGTTSYTASNAYYQVGKSSEPATSITFTTTLPSEGNITAFSAKFGGFNGTAGAVTLKVDDTSVGTGSLNATIDVTISNSSQATGKKLTVTVTGIAKGVKVYYISYTYTTSSGGSEPETPATELTNDQFAWSAATAEATMGASNTFPTLTNTLPVSVTYESSNTAAATIAADGTITLVAPGTTTISAKFAGGEVGGTTYAAKTVTYALTVLKAPATPTENVYVKVTEIAGITDGEYLIVYEDAEGNPKAPVAFDGSLAPVKLDVASNNIEVSIASNTIAGNTDIDAATFTINTAAGTIQTKDGYYIGQTSNANGLATSTTTEYTNTISIENDGSATIISSGGAYLRYNSANDNLRFRYFKSSTYTAQKAVALYKKVDPNAVVEPQFKLAAGEYYGTQSVEITCATTGAEIYYTLNGTDPTSASTKYTGAISIASTTTVKAIAVKGANSSEVVSATYTILAPLATMQEIFDKATDATQSVHIKFNDWVISGVVPGKDEKPSSNAYITDGSKGFIIYTKDGHGFNVGDKLSGTVVCDLTRYNGSAEVVGLTSSTTGLSVTTGGVVTPVVVDDVTTLGGVNTGSVIKITGPCTVDGTKYYVAGVQLFNSLYTYTNPEDGYNYECTGVYLQYNTTEEILPRKAEDLVKIETQQPAGISFAVTEHTAEVGAAEFAEPTLTNPNSLTVTYKTSDETLATVDATTGEVTIGNKEGKVTITASFAGDDDYVAADASYNITITDPSISEATFVAATDLGNTTRGEGSIAKSPITFACSDGILGNGEEYRLYQHANITFAAENGYAITKVVITSTASGTSQYGPGLLSTENGTYSVSDKTGTWVGEAQTVTFTATAQSRAKLITVYYKTDNRQDAGLVWSTENVSITLGDAFTTPTLSNPNGLTLTCTSDNENLATVTNAGEVTLKSGVTGKATITAKFDGNSNYKDATVTCTITVNPKTEIVVILVQYNGQWYALKNVEETAGKVLAALPVNYVGGKLYNVEEADKATIEWQRAAITDGIIFKNGENYIYGTAGSTDLKLSTTECAWTLDGTTYKLGNRTFFYNETANGFKNYNTSNAGNSGYSNLPVVTAPVYGTGTITPMENLTPQMYGTICLENNVVGYEGITFYEVAGKEDNKVIFDEVTELVAGMPYIYIADSETATIVKGNETAAEAGYHKSLQGTFTQIDPAESNILTGNYILYNNVIKKCGKNCGLKDHKAYFITSGLEGLSAPQAQMPGRRRVSLNTTGENAATGIGDVVVPTEQATKTIINGQLIIIRDGEKFNAQGQRL